LAGLAGFKERFQVLPADVDAVAAYVREHAAVMAQTARGRGGESEGKTP